MDAISEKYRPRYCRYCGEAVSRREKEGKDRFYCENCGRFLWQDNSPCVSVLIEKDGKILLVKRGIKPWKGKWSLPAGYQELGEEPAEAAARELGEETGVEVDPGELEAVENIFLRLPDGKNIVNSLYRTESYRGKPEARQEIERAEFRNPETVEKTPFLEKVLEAV